MNVLTALHDAARRGDGLAAGEPITWEATSGVAELIACPIVIFALLVAPLPRDRWRRALPVHALATVAFSGLHILLMFTMRSAIYRAVGYHYRIEAGAALYEYRKDVLAYLVFVGVFHLLCDQHSHVDRRPATRQSERIVIADGRRTWRVIPDELLAVRLAGNYVEFLLADGTRPLVRSTLAEWERRLAPLGFSRVHRGWLLNPRRVCHVSPTGSGDYAVSLGDDLVVPVSRRFAWALGELTS